MSPVCLVFAVFLLCCSSASSQSPIAPSLSTVPAVQSTLVPLPSNFMGINDTSDGLDVCERVTLLIVIVSAVCGALLSLVLVLFLWCIVALARKRVRQRNVRLAGSVRRIAPYPARRVAMPSMFHLHNNVCYGTNPLLVRNEDIGVSSRQFSPCSVSSNPSYCSTSASPTTDSKSPTHQYDDIILNISQKDEDPTEVYDTLHPKSKGRAPSSDHDYENTTQIHNACFSPSQAAINTLLLHTRPQATAQDRLSTLSEEDYVNEFDGPFTLLPMSQLSQQPPASLLKRHCTTSSISHSHLSKPHTSSSHFSKPHTPRDYEVPLTTRRLKKNITMKW